MPSLNFDSQVITASTGSTNIIDFNPAFNFNTVIDAGAGEPTFLVVIPSVTFAAAEGGDARDWLRLRAATHLPRFLKAHAALKGWKPAVVVLALPFGRISV